MNGSRCFTGSGRPPRFIEVTLPGSTEPLRLAECVGGCGFAPPTFERRPRDGRLVVPEHNKPLPETWTALLLVGEGTDLDLPS